MASVTLFPAPSAPRPSHLDRLTAGVRRFWRTQVALQERLVVREVPWLAEPLRWVRGADGTWRLEGSVRPSVITNVR